jgi:hypothetical protein
MLTLSGLRRSPGMDTEQALAVVARQVVSAACTEDFATGVEWGNYPEIGEADWIAVVARVEALTTPPGATDWHEAYALLEARADPTAEATP